MDADRNGKARRSGAEGKAAGPSSLLAKWEMLVAFVEGRLKKAIAREERNGKARTETEKTVALYIKTLQAFGRAAKELAASGGDLDAKASRQVAESIWSLSLSKAERAAIAGILKDLGLSVARRGATGGRRSSGRKRPSESQEDRADQGEISFTESEGEGARGGGVVETG